MHEVIGRVDALQRLVQRTGVKNIAPHDLRGCPDFRPQFFRVSGQTTQGHRLLFEQRNQPTADVARCTRQKDNWGLRCIKSSLTPLVASSFLDSLAGPWGVLRIRFNGGILSFIEARHMLGR